MEEITTTDKPPWLKHYEQAQRKQTRRTSKVKKRQSFVKASGPSESDEDDAMVQDFLENMDFGDSIEAVGVQDPLRMTSESDAEEMDEDEVEDWESTAESSSDSEADEEERYLRESRDSVKQEIAPQNINSIINRALEAQAKLIGWLAHDTTNAVAFHDQFMNFLLGSEPSFVVAAHSPRDRRLVVRLSEFYRLQLQLSGEKGPRNAPAQFLLTRTENSNRRGDRQSMLALRHTIEKMDKRFQRWKQTSYPTQLDSGWDSPGAQPSTSRGGKGQQAPRKLTPKQAKRLAKKQQQEQRPQVQAPRTVAESAKPLMEDNAGHRMLQKMGSQLSERFYLHNCTLDRMEPGSSVGYDGTRGNNRTRGSASAWEKEWRAGV